MRISPLLPVSPFTPVSCAALVCEQSFYFPWSLYFPCRWRTEVQKGCQAERQVFWSFKSPVPCILQIPLPNFYHWGGLLHFQLGHKGVWRVVSLDQRQILPTGTCIRIVKWKVGERNSTWKPLTWPLAYSFLPPHCSTCWCFQGLLFMSSSFLCSFPLLLYLWWHISTPASPEGLV